MESFPTARCGRQLSSCRDYPSGRVAQRLRQSACDVEAVAVSRVRPDDRESEPTRPTCPPGSARLGSAGRLVGRLPGWLAGWSVGRCRRIAALPTFLHERSDCSPMRAVARRFTFAACHPAHSTVHAAWAGRMRSRSTVFPSAAETCGKYYRERARLALAAVSAGKFSWGGAASADCVCSWSSRQPIVPFYLIILQEMHV